MARTTGNTNANDALLNAINGLNAGNGEAKASGDNEPETTTPESTTPADPEGVTISKEDFEYFQQLKVQEADRHEKQKTNPTVSISQQDYDLVQGMRESYQEFKEFQEAKQRGAWPVVENVPQERKLTRHEALTKHHGPGYVEAQKGDNKKVFSKVSWDMIGGNSNTEGWKQIIEVPTEVQRMKK